MALSYDVVTTKLTWLYYRSHCGPDTVEDMLASLFERNDL